MTTTILKQDIQDLVIGGLRCDATVNAIIYFKNGGDIELFGLSNKQADQLEAWNISSSISIEIDDRFLNRSDELFLAQNGIK